MDGVHTRQSRDGWVLVKAAGVTEKLKASFTLKLPTSQKMLKKKKKGERTLSFVPGKHPNWLKKIASVIQLVIDQ